MNAFRKFAFWIEYVILRMVAFLINILPYPTAVLIGRKAGILIYHLLPKKRKIALDNLHASFPEKSDVEIHQIARGAFSNMAHMAIEFVCIPKLIKQNMIRFSNAQNIGNALKKNLGTILIVSHFTNWEVMAIATGATGFPTRAIARPLKNPFVYRYVKHLRGLGGVRSIDKDGALREVVKDLRQNKVVAFLIDQHERQGAVVTQLFGRPCYTSSFAVQIAMKFKVPMVATFCYRGKDGILTTDYEKEFNLIDTGNEEKDIQANTQMLVSNMERVIREQPENWLWMHRRWRI